MVTLTALKQPVDSSFCFTFHDFLLLLKLLIVADDATFAARVVIIGHFV